MLLLSRWHRCLEPFSHLLKGRVIDFATGIPLTEYIHSRGLVHRGRGWICDERRVSPGEPVEKRPDQQTEQSYPENCPKQGNQPPKKVRTMFKSKHTILSFRMSIIIHIDRVTFWYRYAILVKTHIRHLAFAPVWIVTYMYQITGINL